MPPDARLTAYTSPASLPSSARSLFGQTDIYSTYAWYSATAAHACPEGATPLFLAASVSGEVAAIFPLLRGPGKALSSFSTPYTGLWRPLFATNLPTDTLQAIAAAFVKFCRQSPVARLDALDPIDPFLPILKSATRAEGFVPLSFAHFGNWHEPLLTGIGWDTYLAARPGALREAIRRKNTRIFGNGTGLVAIATSRDTVAPAIADYENVYAASWKQPEPYPGFIPAFAEAAAEEKTLHLALLYKDNTPIAAQLWTLHSGTATVMKLAHRKDADAYSPGTVLTACVIRHLLETQAVSNIDFGRGDDSYKSAWTTRRRQCVGIIFANPLTATGLHAILRHAAGGLKRAFRSHRSAPRTPSEPPA